MIYAISSIYSSFWCETSRNWEGQLFFHFNFLFFMSSFKKKPCTFPVGEAILVTLPLPQKTLQCIFRISVVLTGAGLDKAKELWIWGKIVTYCYILKNPYTEETLKIFHKGHISCWYEKFVCLRIFLVGICGPAAYETVAWRWLKPFRLGHSQLDKVDCISIMAICQRPALSSEFSWGKAMDPKLLLKNFGKRWSMSCQHLVWTNLHLKNSRPKLDKAQLVGGVFPKYLPNYLQILVGVRFFCMHERSLSTKVFFQELKSVARWYLHTFAMHINTYIQKKYVW